MLRVARPSLGVTLPEVTNRGFNMRFARRCVMSPKCVMSCPTLDTRGR